MEWRSFASYRQDSEAKKEIMGMKLPVYNMFKGKEQSFFSNNFIVLNHIQICFITIYDGCLT